MQASNDSLVPKQEPLVSIICFCKNSARTIRRSMQSVLSQSYRNIEYVIQDGLSTDGTLEIIRSFDNPRIKLVSERDASTGDAHWKALHRCCGEIVGTCLADDELVPGAIATAVERFQGDPTAGAITGDSYWCDVDGNITGQYISKSFDLVQYLFGAYCPYFPATFFRRQAFLDVGMEWDDQWEVDYCLEYEIWFRFGTQHRIKYLPGFVSKYAMHADQSSHNLAHSDRNLEGWLRLIDKWFSAEGFFGDDPIKKNACIYNRLYTLFNHFRWNNASEQMSKLYYRIKQLQLDLLRSYTPADHGASNRFFHPYLEAASAADPQGADRTKQAVNHWHRLTSLVPPIIKRAIPVRIKRFIANLFMRAAFRVGTKRAARQVKDEIATPKSLSEAELDSLRPLQVSKLLYTHVGDLYYVRGQIDEALEMWRAADNADDETAESRMCSAMQMSPTATSETIREFQEWWARRHAVPKPTRTRHAPFNYRGDRKLRIGYHCSWLGAITYPAIMQGVLRAHDRGKVTVYGYSPWPPADLQIEGVFDVFRKTLDLTHEQYLELIRSDRIDILVELSGFSDGNRFGAMASRCAPIQVAYVNHHATTGVPNVDYMITDAIAAPAGDERLFSERLYRLPGCFLCYNYDFEESLPITLLPKDKNGFVTFGCFGIGAKFNTDLIGLWGSVLQRVPGSKVLICNVQLKAPGVRKFLVDRFRRFGIDSSRLLLREGTNDRRKVLGYLSELDISLDTSPYNGGNAIAESLWHGVPVITLRGQRMASRYGASLVTAAGCPDLVAESPTQYAEIAEALARDNEKLRRLRQDLRQMVTRQGSTDPAGMARRLEAAYHHMASRAQELNVAHG